MREIEFEDVCDLIHEIDSLFCMETGENINIVASYEEIKEILEDLIINDFSVYDVIFRAPKPSGYDKEYILTIDIDGDISIVPAWVGDKYIALDADDITLVSDTVNSKFVIQNKYANITEYAFADECDEDCDNCECNHAPQTKESGEVYTEKSDHGITQSWVSPDGHSYFSRSVYSSDSDRINDIIKEWENFARNF